MARSGAEEATFSALHSCKCSVPSSAEHPITDHSSCLLHMAELIDGSTHETQPIRLNLPSVQKDSADRTRWASSFCRVDVCFIRGLHRLRYQCMDAFSTVTYKVMSGSSDIAYIQVRGIWYNPDYDMARPDFHKKLLPSHSLWNFYIDVHFAERLIPLIDRAFIVYVRMPLGGS